MLQIVILYLFRSRECINDFDKKALLTSLRSDGFSKKLMVEFEAASRLSQLIEDLAQGMELDNRRTRNKE